MAAAPDDAAAQARIDLEPSDEEELWTLS